MNYKNYKNALKLKGKWSYSVNIATAISTLRMKLGLTQREFAEKLDFQQETISRLESANHYPTIKTLERIAKKLKMDLVIKFKKLN